ncbi:MAG: beta-ketoacyl-ACP synthase III [Syntrophotaleaceae bacterium]
MKYSRIIGTGSFLPERVLTNKDLEQILDTSDEWIVTRTGISERRIAGEKEHTSDLAAQAARRALEMAGLTAGDIDLIVVATVTGDFSWPATACMVQTLIGADRAFAFDVSAACSGFLYGLATADNFLRSGSARRALVIGAEIFSRIVDWEDRATCVLFGDAAGAVVLEQQEGDRGILSTHLHSDGSFWELLYQPGFGSRNPYDGKGGTAQPPYLQMKGNEVFKVAVRSLYEVAIEALGANGMTVDDIDWFIPHQANNRIIEAAAKRLELPLEKLVVNVSRVGNTSGASIPVALDEINRNGSLNPGNIILMDAFGAGFTWGSALIRW